MRTKGRLGLVIGGFLGLNYTEKCWKIGPVWFQGVTEELVNVKTAGLA